MSLGSIKIIDVHDKTHLRYSIGFGHWVTMIEYKDIEIKSLDGKV